MQRASNPSFPHAKTQQRHWVGEEEEEKVRKFQDTWVPQTVGICWSHIRVEVCCRYVFERFIYLVFHSLTNTYWATIMCYILCEVQKIQTTLKNFENWWEEKKKEVNKHDYIDNNIKIRKNKELWVRNLEEKGELEGIRVFAQKLVFGSLKREENIGCILQRYPKVEPTVNATVCLRIPELNHSTKLLHSHHLPFVKQ